MQPQLYKPVAFVCADTGGADEDTSEPRRPTPEKLQASSAAGHCYSEKKTRCGTLIQSIFAETRSVL